MRHLKSSQRFLQQEWKWRSKRRNHRPRPCGHKANINGSCGGKGSRGCEHGAKIKQWMEEKADKEKAKKKAEGGAYLPRPGSFYTSVDRPITVLSPHCIPYYEYEAHVHETR